MIKILHIQETIASGGVEKIRLSLARLLNKNVFEQKIICTHAEGYIKQEIESEGVEIIPIGILKHPFQWSQHKKVQKIIDEYKPDIIHGAVFEGVTMAAVNGWVKRVPTIVIEETSDPQNRSWRGNFLIKIFSIFSDKVIGVSESVTKEYLIRNLGISPQKAITINNGVELPRKVSVSEKAQLKEKLGIQETDFVVGSVGRMLQDSHKRFSDLIKAFASYSKGKTNVKLLFVGEGKEMRSYQNLCKHLSIEDKVIFAGYQYDTALFYQLMDVFCLVSAREAFGLVLTEAMLSKLPIIATKVGGMKYIVKDRETGFLVEKYDVDAISEKLELLYQNQELAYSLGEMGYKRAMEEYTEEVYVQKIEKLYLDLYNKKSS